MTSVHDRLHELGRALRRARLTRSALLWLSGTLGLWLLWCWLDNLLRLPAGLRLAMLAAGVAVPLWRAWQGFLHPRHWRLSHERTARELETLCGVSDNALINACLFERRAWPGAAGVFAARTIADGAAGGRAIQAEALRDTRRVWRLGAVAAAAGLLWAAYALLLSRAA
ncbi:MAG: hypothetical protein PHR35_07760, partial [Kiritimatiellae bacterium]|nr:hypothetical protein [Kiritimatiellia bacterium]